MPVCIRDFEESFKYFGLCPEWILIELTVWACFTTTMLILMIKSRLFQVGINQAIQFDESHITQMINDLLKMIAYTKPCDPKSNKSKKEVCLFFGL